MEEYGFKSMEIPKTRSRTGKIINAFIDSKDECVGKEYEDIIQLKKDMNTMKGYISYHKIKSVKVSKYGNTLMLVRKE